MTTENVMKLGKIERLSFSFVLLSILQIYQPWPLEKIKQTVLSMYCIIKKKKKKKRDHQKSIRVKQWKMH